MGGLYLFSDYSLFIRVRKGQELLPQNLIQESADSKPEDVSKSMAIYAFPLAPF
jgi:hypothetical protein